jgi:hypothetical protein
MEVLFPGSTGVRRRFPVHFHELTDRQPLRFDLGPAGLVVVPFAVVHASGAPALALRVAWQGHTIAYTGDTEWTEALVELARGADLLIAEGYTHQRRIRFHLGCCSAQDPFQRSTVRLIAGAVRRCPPVARSRPGCSAACTSRRHGLFGNRTDSAVRRMVGAAGW